MSSPAIDETTSTTCRVPRQATLDGFSAAAEEANGIYLRDLEPLTTLLVRTCNSLYRIIVSERTSVLVQGGQFFPIPTAARLEGSSFGGSFLKMAWVGVGLSMEFWAEGQRIITSPVRAIEKELQIDRPAAIYH